MPIKLKHPLPRFTLDKTYDYREFTHRFLERDGTHGVCLAREVLDDEGNPVWYTERPGVAWHRPWNQFDKDWGLPACPQCLATPLITNTDYLDIRLENIEEANKFKFFPAQKAALHSCIRRNGNLLLVGDTGTGKTLMGYTLLDFYADSEKTSLILAPQAVLGQWRSEIEKYFGHTNVTTLEDWTPDFKGVVLTHPQRLFHRSDPVALAFRDQQFSVVLVDESHMYGSDDSLLTLGLLMMRSDKRIALSATPVSNYLSELFPMFRWLKQADFPYKSYERAEFLADCYTSDNTLTLKAHRILDPIVVRVEKHECRKAVSVMHTKRIKLPLREDIKARLLSASPERQRRMLYTSGLQAGKTIWMLRTLARAISKGEQLVIICARVEQTTQYARILTELGVTYRRIDSAMPAKWHGNEAEAFKEGKATVMLMGSRCAQSHSFQQCPNLFIGSIGYSYGEFWQAIGRVWRVNSERPVHVTVPYYPDTIEGKLWDYVFSKQSLARNYLFPESKLSDYLQEYVFWDRPVGSLTNELLGVENWKTILKRCLDRRASVNTVTTTNL